MKQAAQNRLFGLASQSSCQCDQLMCLVQKCAGDPAAPTIPTVQADGKVDEKGYSDTDDPESTTSW